MSLHFPEANIMLAIASFKSVEQFLGMLQKQINSVHGFKIHEIVRNLPLRYDDVHVRNDMLAENTKDIVCCHSLFFLDDIFDLKHTNPKVT